MTNKFINFYGFFASYLLKRNTLRFGERIRAPIQDIFLQHTYYYKIFDVYWTVHLCDSWSIKKPTRCNLFYLLYFLDIQHVSGINMSIFRSLRLCCWTTTLAVLFFDCFVLGLGCGSSRVVSGLPASVDSPDTTLDEPHPNPNTQQSKNNTANVVVQQHSSRQPGYHPRRTAP